MLSPKKKRKIKLSYSKYLITYLFLYLIFQINHIVEAGTSWDDLKLVETTPRIIHKFNLFFIDPTNGFLSEFVSNFEFYGYLVLIPTYLFSKSEIVRNLFSYVLTDLFSINILNNQDFEYILRHIFLSIYVIFSLFIIFKIYSKISDEKRAFQFIIIFSLIPLFSGHSLFNLKDVPFMIQSFIAGLFFIDYLVNFNKVKNYDFLKPGFFFGLLLLIRFNGIAIIAIYFLFSFLYLNKDLLVIKKNVLNLISILAVSLFVLFLGTPSAWQKPRLWIEKTIETQFNLYWDSYILTNGKYIFAMDIDPMYLLTWLNFRLPIVFHIFFILSIYLFVRSYMKKRFEFSILFIFSLFFICFIVISFMILRPIAYDGIRQYLFLIPFFGVVAVECMNYLKLDDYRKNIIFLISVFYLLFTSAGLGPYRYVYFNELTNEKNITIDCDEVGGCGDWQTDYWGYSGKSLINNINKNFQGKVYLCTPEHVFSTYINNNEVEIISDFKDVEGEFFLAYLHRPMLKNDTCGFKEKNLTFKCSNFVTKETSLRNNKINLSYIDKCINN